MNAVIACGGTGGHLFPGIAVAEVLRDRGHEVMLLISEKDIDALALSGRTNFRVEKLPTVGLPSAFSPAFFGFIRRFYESLS
ncbi:MAG: undecaprenyldiphospho-muramoylpentapeptide beta-N-acetylglucosaminyltransferase, partial [Verrucomicrobia bacterium]